MSVHHPIIYTGLENITQMFLSIEMKVHFFFDKWMEYREKNHPKDSVIE